MLATAAESPIAQQALFSVYVHTAPGFSYAPGSVFAGYETGQRLPVSWGQHSIVSHACCVHMCKCCKTPYRPLCCVQVQAERLLLREALAEPLNERFVLLSESCLPLYPPGKSQALSCNSNARPRLTRSCPAGMMYAQLLLQPLSCIHACAAPTKADEARRLMYRSAAAA